MAAFVFNQADTTLLNAISATWVGNATLGDATTFWVQSSKLQATSGSTFAEKAAYLNEAGSTYAIAKFVAGTSNDYRIIIHSSDGTFNNGYYCKLTGVGGNVYRNGVYETGFTIPGGINVDSSNVEVRIERVSTTVNVYAGPVGSTSLAGTFSDLSPISGGFSGFYFASGGTVTGGVISFDNGVAAPTTPTDTASFNRGVGRGIARGLA